MPRVTTSPDDTALARVRELTTPTVAAVRSPTTVGSMLAGLWAGRRLPAAVVLAAVLLAALLVLATPTASWWVLALVSVGAGLALATYLPAAGQSWGASFGGLCGIAGFCLPLMGVSQLVQGAAGTASGYAVALVVVGLAQRVLTAGSCGTR